MKRVNQYNFNIYEANRIGKPYHGSKILVFDLDDTLVISSAKIKVCNKKTGECFSLTPEEFNTYEKNSDHVLNFEEFKSLEIMKAGEMIEKYLKRKAREFPGPFLFWGACIGVQIFIGSHPRILNPKP